MYWLRLIRWNNLLIVLLTQLLAWWCVIVPMQQHVYSMQEYDTITGEGVLKATAILLTPFNFSLLCISTMLIAAAGYIINDYFDIRIDAINKPDKVILEKQIPRKLAIIVHSAMNVVALFLAAIVAWQARHLEYLLLQAACTFILWRYSTTWKRQFMIGNVMVALMTALTVVTLMLYEPALKNFLTAGVADLFWGDFNPALMLYFLCAFAFILTWMREITKDMEDYKGDAEDGCDTMPIKWGLKKSILFIRLLGTVALIGISLSIVMGVLADKLIATNYAMTVYLSILFIAILAWLIFLGKKFTKQHFHKASTYLKLIMVLGIGSLIIYRLQYA